uniref:Uncharacterized protein n=1 Tax=Leersia perrieri TaxID=77586 RepID=A0A0D9W132_9ORYZ
MKPHFPGEGSGSWAHEVKQALRDKLRRAYATAGAARPAATASCGPSNGDDCRSSAAEDPIRRVILCMHSHGLLDCKANA